MPPVLQIQAKLQAGVISRRQALDAKLTPDVIRARAASGRWRRIYRGIYATFNGPLTRDARLWAAVLYAGTGAVLSHETAAELHNLNDGQSPLIHVTVPLERQVRALPGMMVHRSERLAEQDLKVPAGQLPRTPVEETILDLASNTDNVDDVCALVARAFARNLTSVQFMGYALAQRERQKWRAEISEFVTAAVGGAHSVLEFRYDRDVEKAHGLPLSRHQVSFKKKDGSRGYRDRVFEDWKLIIELEETEPTRTTSGVRTSGGTTQPRRTGSSPSATDGRTSGGIRATLLRRSSACCATEAGKEHLNPARPGAKSAAL